MCNIRCSFCNVHSSIFKDGYPEVVQFMNLQCVCLCADVKINSGHALPFHFLLNSLVNAELCFVKALKSPTRTIWVQRSPLEAIYYGWPLQGSDLLLCARKGFASFWPATPPWPEAGLPLSGKRSSLQPSPQPNGCSTAVSDRLYFTTNSFKRRNRPCFAAVF